MRVRIIADLPGLVIADVGRVQGPSGRWLKLFPNKKNPYLHFNVYRSKKWKQYSIHTVVCTAFHGPRPDGLVVRHLDGDPTNNHADNLCWGTHVENEADKELHGTRIKGEKHHAAKLTEADVIAIRSAPQRRGVGKELAAFYGVSASMISAIRLGKNWSHV